jgi:hypothetical protein
MEPPRIAAMRVEQGRGTERVSLARHLLKLTIASSQQRLPACDRFGDQAIAPVQAGRRGSARSPSRDLIARET